MREMTMQLRNGFGKNKIHPQKFALLVACASLLMLFAAFTSAFIVRQAAGNWLEFELPGIFFFSTLVILVSSATLHASYFSFKKGNAALYKGLLTLTFVLGLTFIVMQYQGWVAMKNMGVELTRNPSGDFVYVISGIHAAHVLGGIAAIFVAIIHAFSLKQKVTPKRKLRLEMTLIYWHFVDFLWVYLLLFFVYQR